MPYEKIVLQGKEYVSIEALSLLNQNNRNIVLTDTFGKPIAFMNGMMNSLTATKYRIAQCDAFRDKSKKDYLAKQIIRAKKESQIQLSQSIGSKADNLPEKESTVSKIYFEELPKIFRKDMGFHLEISHLSVLANTVRQESLTLLRISEESSWTRLHPFMKCMCILQSIP